jgi:hypothetical protein
MSLSVEILTFISGSMKNHIRGTDLKLGPYFIIIWIALAGILRNLRGALYLVEFAPKMKNAYGGIDVMLYPPFE